MDKKRLNIQKSDTSQDHPPDAAASSQKTTPCTYHKDPFQWLIAVLLSVVGMAAYLTSFQNGFIWDDTMVITPNEYIRGWGNLKHIFTTDIHHFGLDQSNFYRPFQAVSYVIDYTLWQLNPMGYHISSVVYHIINAFLLFILFHTIIIRLSEELKHRARDIALAVSMIWLVSPIHTQAVTYAAGRADILVTLFILLTLWAFMTGRCVLSWVCFIGALLSKEYGMITLLFVLLFDYFGLTVQSGKRWKRYAPFVGILGMYILLRLTVLHFPQDPNTGFVPGMYGRLLTSSQAMVILLGLLVAPFDLSMDRNIAWADTLFHWKVLASGICVVSLFISAYLCRKKQKLISFGLGFYIAGYCLFLNIIPMNANVSEHWMYVPSAGVWLVVCALLVKHIAWLKKPLWLGLVAGFCLYLSYFLIQRNADFKNELTFYHQILDRNYANARVHYNLGCAYFFEEDMEKSRFHLQEAIRFNPDYAAAYGNLGQLEFRTGHVDQAIALYEHANRLDQRLIENHVNLGTAYTEKERLKEAIHQFQRALELSPNHTGAMNNLGIVYGRMGQFDMAEQYFLQALRSEPANLSAQNNLKYLKQLQQHSTP